MISLIPIQHLRLLLLHYLSTFVNPFATSKKPGPVTLTIVACLLSCNHLPNTPPACSWAPFLLAPRHTTTSVQILPSAPLFLYMEVRESNNYVFKFIFKLSQV